MRKPRTTDSTHGLPLYPNLIYNFIPGAVNQLWISDITYMPIRLGDNEYLFCYLSTIMDADSHELIGWSVGPTLEPAYTCQALKMALGCLDGMSEEDMRKLIHHSDIGVLYASKAYIGILQRNCMRISMTENGDPKENAMAEHINSTIKNELLKTLRALFPSH